VGYTFDAEGAHAGFVWSAGVLTLVSGSSSFGAVNDGGIAVGGPAGKDPDYVVYNIASGALTEVQVPFAKKKSQVFPDGINSAGVAVGSIDAPNDRSSVVGFISSNGNTVELLPPQEKQSFPLGVNKSGAVLVRCGFIYYDPFIYYKNSFTQFSVPGASVTAPSFITDNGTVGGYAVFSGVGAGFTKNGSTYTTYNAPSAPYTAVTGIGPMGQVYGSFVDSSGVGHGFVNANGVFYQIDVPNSTSTTIAGVGSSGTIFGVYTDSQGSYGYIGKCSKKSVCTQ
jgi:hypothetical protein